MVICISCLKTIINNANRRLRRTTALLPLLLYEQLHYIILMTLRGYLLFVHGEILAVRRRIICILHVCVCVCVCVFFLIFHVSFCFLQVFRCRRRVKSHIDLRSIRQIDRNDYTSSRPYIYTRGWCCRFFPSHPPPTTLDNLAVDPYTHIYIYSSFMLPLLLLLLHIVCSETTHGGDLQLSLRLLYIILCEGARKYMCVRVSGRLYQCYNNNNISCHS